MNIQENNKLIAEFYGCLPKRGRAANRYEKNGIRQ